jgi:two-component system chemotaxis response regulator CheY
VIVPEQVSALIVDDNAYARGATAATLRKLGLSQIREADSGAEAIVQLLGARFDVMLMDWYMPEISGAGLMHVIRDKRFGPSGELPVILITAYASRDNIARARALGVNEVLTKPFTADHVMLALGRVLPNDWGMPAAEPQAAASGQKTFL